MSDLLAWWVVIQVIGAVAFPIGFVFFVVRLRQRHRFSHLVCQFHIFITAQLQSLVECLGKNEHLHCLVEDIAVDEVLRHADKHFRVCTRVK